MPNLLTQVTQKKFYTCNAQFSVSSEIFESFFLIHPFHLQRSPGFACWNTNQSIFSITLKISKKKNNTPIPKEIKIFLSWFDHTPTQNTLEVANLKFEWLFEWADGFD